MLNSAESPSLGATHALTPAHGKAALAAYFLGKEAAKAGGVSDRTMRTAKTLRIYPRRLASLPYLAARARMRMDPQYECLAPGLHWPGRFTGLSFLHGKAPQYECPMWRPIDLWRQFLHFSRCRREPPDHGHLQHHD